MSLVQSALQCTSYLSDDVTSRLGQRPECRHEDKVIGYSLEYTQHKVYMKKLGKYRGGKCSYVCW